MTATIHTLPESELPALYQYEVRRERIISDSHGVIRSPSDVPAIAKLLIDADSLDQEQLGVLICDTKNNVIGGQILYKGNLAGSSVRVGEIFRLAVMMQAACIIVIHNHPSGDPTPSGEDTRITAEIAEAGRLLDIEVLDHIILGANNRTISLRALGLIGGGAS